MLSFFKKLASKIYPALEARVWKNVGADGSTFQWSSPLSLLVAQRFDIGAKLIYAQLRERGVMIPWTESAYRHHLYVWGRFIEEAPPKTGYEDYKEAFNAILDATKFCKERGLLSIVPLSHDGRALNGSHRIAAALLYDREIITTRIDIPKTYCNFDYRFFRNLISHRGDPWLEDVWDAVALKLCETMPNIFVATLFPAGSGKDAQVDEILSECGDFVYEKVVEFSEVGRLNLIRTIYEGEPWVGSTDDDFYHARKKARDVFLEGGPVRFIFFVANHGSDLTKAKEVIRDLFGKGKSSIHINDSRHEAVRIAQAVLSLNSRHFLNHAKPANFSNFQRLFPIYQSMIAKTGDSERYCIDGSAVLACYGLRDCRDIDYLHYLTPLTDSDEISSHNAHASLYAPLTPVEIIFDPRRHFYFGGMKFTSLSVIRDGKKIRGEPKDIADISLINE